MTCEIGVSIQDLLDRRSGEKVVVQFATFSAEPDTVLRQSAKIEIAAIAIVEKDPVRASLLQSDIKRNRLINWIATERVTGRVGIPIHKKAAPFVQMCGFLSKPIKVLIKS